MQRIAFFGGSFNPPHRGHLAIAKAAADQFSLDQVLFAPVGSQPLKENSPATPFIHRYAMTALATQIDARYLPSLIDAPSETGQPNYTVETLERLWNSPSAESALFTLLGADSWLNIARWHQPARLLALCDWIVAARPGFSLAAAERALPAATTAELANDGSGDFLRLVHPDGSITRVFFLTSVYEDISASALRRALETGGARAELLPAAVDEYIEKTGLYRPRM